MRQMRLPARKKCVILNRVVRVLRAYKAQMIGKSLCVGVLVGLVVSAYRLALKNAESLTFAIYAFLRLHWVAAVGWFAVLVGLALFIGWLSKRYPMIGGSGIPQVKGIMQGVFEDTWLATLTAKFTGGFLSIAAGLSLGREGPSIQLGACVADGVGRLTKSADSERKLLIAGGASAGLAAAFGAPLAGVIFAVEEIFGSISATSLMTCMVSAASAEFVAGTLFGLEPVFHFEMQSMLPLENYWVLLALGIVVGLAGVVYNWGLINGQRLFLRLPFTKTIARPIPAFLLAGVMGLVFPVVLAGGHAIEELLTPETAITMLALVLVVKYLFSVVSFSSGAPGGIFFPLLMMGATLGAIVAKVAIFTFGIEAGLFQPIMIYAMAGFFTAIVRAPITGIVLLTEMTAAPGQLFPFVIVCVTAYITVTALKSPPIYDSLLEALKKNRAIPQAKKTDRSDCC